MTIKQDLYEFYNEDSATPKRIFQLSLGYIFIFISAAAILISVNTLFGSVVPINFWTVLSGVLLIDFVESIADRIGGSSNYVADSE